MATPLTQRPGHLFSHTLGNVLVQMRRNPVLAAVGIILLVLLFFLLLPGGQRSSRPAKGTVTVSPVTAKEYEAALVQRYERQFHDLQTQLAAESKQRDAALDTVRGEVQQLSTSLQQELATLHQTLQPRAPARPGNAILVMLCLKHAANTSDYPGCCRLAPARQHYLDITTQVLIVARDANRSAF